MKKPLGKKLLPHLLAIIVFLLVSVLFCKPALEGKVLVQHDNVGWKGMAQNSFDYKKQHGHFPLWNPNLFSGMPNYQVAMEGKSVMPDMTKILTLGLPKPINFFFLACIGFYILCLALRVRSLPAVICSLAYAFSTYNAVIVFAGHDTQMLATGIMPLLMAGLVFTYDKKYWLGLALTSFGAYQQIGVNHLQVTYYFFLIALLVTIGYLVKWIMEKQWKHIVISGAIVLGAALIGVMSNALGLMTTSEYSKFTMRNGKDVEIKGDTVTATKTKGLDTAYAFEYSVGKAETFTLLMPEAFGGSTAKTVGEGSAVIKKLTDKGVDEGSAMQVADALPRYWGALPSTAGPAYLGVLIVLLGLIGFFFVKHPIKWGLLAATVLGILMYWGKNFAGFNVFLFEHLPLYNKFRSPAFAQVIPQFTIGIMAALALQQIFYNQEGSAWLRADLKKLLYIVGGVVGLGILAYLMMDYTSPIDRMLISAYTDKNGNDEMGRLIVSGLKSDRRALFGGQLLRLLLFAALLLGIVWLYLKNVLKGWIAVAIILVISTIEITVESKGYLKDENYVASDEYDGMNFSPTPADQQILKDKDPNYRVLNMAADTYNDSRTSYYHKSIGGYHPAKLRIYQDMIEKYLGNRPHPEILNMLNAKYVIVADPQTRQEQVMQNTQAYGNCWFVKHIQLVGDRVQALQALGNTNLKDTAIVESSVYPNPVQPVYDSSATIKMTSFDNDAIEYESSSSAPGYAVLSEVYYPKGWNAYIDGKPVAYYNTDYILRGMPVPAGKHKIRFAFEPASVSKGRSYMFLGSILTLLALLGGLFMAWWQDRKKTVQ